MIWVLPALAAPLGVELGEPGFHDADRSRYGLVIPSDAGDMLLASPLVHERTGRKCDGDEWGFGDPSGTTAPPRWCPSGGEEDGDPALIPLRGELVLESPNDLEPLEPIRTVWSHTFWSSEQSNRRPCGEQTWADNAGGVLHGLSRDARVHAGVLRLGEQTCAVTVGPQGFAFEDCTLPPGARGELLLFDFARTPSCDSPSLPAVVLSVTTPELEVLVEEAPLEEPVEQGAPKSWLLIVLAGAGGIVLGLIAARIRERARPTVDEAGPLRSRLQLKERRISDLQAELDQARAGMRALGGRVASLETEKAAEAERVEELAVEKPTAPEHDGLRGALGQALEYPELRSACGAVCDLGMAEHGDLFRRGRDLLEASQRLRALTEGDYHQRWEELEEGFREGYRELSAFAIGARHLGAGSLDDVCQAVLAEKAYSRRSARPARGYRAWASLAPTVERKQQDDGLALANGLRREVFNRFVVPWLRLAQFLVEALPHEVPESSRVDVPVEEATAAALSRLGYGYEHVPLYRVREREFLNRKVLTTPVRLEDILGDRAPPATAAPGLIVRVQVPLVPRAPRGHTVRAVLVYLEA